MKTWTFHEGYPVLNVKLDIGANMLPELHLRQQPLTLANHGDADLGADSKPLWWLPVAFADSVSIGWNLNDKFMLVISILYDQGWVNRVS